jgi:hypothetical protein
MEACDGTSCPLNAYPDLVDSSMGETPSHSSECGDEAQAISGEVGLTSA